MNLALRTIGKALCMAEILPIPTTFLPKTSEIVDQNRDMNLRAHHCPISQSFFFSNIPILKAQVVTQTEHLA